MLCDVIKERKIPSLPDISNFEERRAFIKKLYTEEVYGKEVPRPESVSFETELLEGGNYCAGKALLEKVTVTSKILGREFSFPFKFVHPENKKNQKVIVQINFGPECPHKYTPAEEIIDLGFSVAVFNYQDVTSDNNDFTDGLAGILFPDGKRISPDSTGKIMMWSWAASRVFDYLETLDFVDLDNVTVAGHSRLGKTALVTGAFDERFKYVHSNDSGCGGGAIFRDKRGESVEVIVDHFSFWFCPAFAKYIKNEHSMPFDQHFLVGAIAPRFVHIATAVEDVWADPDSEYLTCVCASAEYERLGLTGFVHPDCMPELEEHLNKGRIGYYVREGRHYFSRYDWKKLTEFINLKIGENK